MRALFLSGASAADGEGGRADVESNRPSSGHVGVVGAGHRGVLRRRDGERNRAESERIAWKRGREEDEGERERELAREADGPSHQPTYLSSAT